MLTRSQVARRLGKSVATVRRLEGVALYPRRDWRGVHLFDEQEVASLACDLRDGGSLPWQARSVRGSTSTTTPRTTTGGTLAARVAQLEHVVSELLDVLSGAR